MLTQLHCFVAVVKSGSFSQSARELQLSQPSLSRQIAQLESQLDMTLLNRHQRPVTPTPAGEFLYRQILPVLEQFEQVLQATKQFANKRYHQLTIGFVASILYGLLPNVIATLRQISPTLEIKLVEMSSYEQIIALQNQKIDVGFGRFVHAESFIRQQVVCQERYVVALPSHHPLTKCPLIHLQELATQTLILYHRTATISDGQSQDQLLHFFASHQIVPTTVRKVRDIQIALGLVAAGEGVTLVPDSLSTVRTMQIAYRPLVHPDVISTIYLNTLTHQVHPALPQLLHAIEHVYAKK